MKYDLARSGEHGVPKAVQDLFQPIVNEIAYAMRLYADSDVTDHRRVEKIILTGGSAHLPGLISFDGEIECENDGRGSVGACASE